jgi:hypothetical protein
MVQKSRPSASGAELLRRSTQKLQRIGRQVATVTFANIISAFVSYVVIAFHLVTESDPRFNIPRTRLLETIISGALTLVALLLLVIYDVARKRGDTLYEEVSEDLEWSPERRTGIRPDTNVRLTLREFSRSTDLPLVAGRMAITIYALVNLGFTALSMFGIRF